MGDASSLVTRAVRPLGLGVAGKLAALRSEETGHGRTDAMAVTVGIFSSVSLRACAPRAEVFLPRFPPLLFCSAHTRPLHFHRSAVCTKRKHDPCRLACDIGPVLTTGYVANAAYGLLVRSRKVTGTAACYRTIWGATGRLLPPSLATGSGFGVFDIVDDLNACGSRLHAPEQLAMRVGIEIANQRERISGGQYPHTVRKAGSDERLLDEEFPFHGVC